METHGPGSLPLPEPGKCSVPPLSRGIGTLARGGRTGGRHPVFAHRVFQDTPGDVRGLRASGGIPVQRYDRDDPKPALRAESGELPKELHRFVGTSLRSDPGTGGAGAAAFVPRAGGLVAHRDGRGLYPAERPCGKRFLPLPAPGVVRQTQPVGRPGRAFPAARGVVCPAGFRGKIPPATARGGHRDGNRRDERAPGGDDTGTTPCDPAGGIWRGAHPLRIRDDRTLVPGLLPGRRAVHDPALDARDAARCDRSVVPPACMHMQ